MFKRVLKFASWTVLVLIALVVGFVGFVVVRADRTFAAPYPDIQASTDPKVIDRGRYLAYGPGHCVACHTPNALEKEVGNGATPPLVGGHEFKLPFGVVRSRNLTPDVETGIGRYSDREIARVLRYGVKPDGRVVLPFMEMQNLTDEDLTAIVSFLRSQEPVRNDVADHQFNLVGKAVLALAMKPVGPAGPILPATPPEGTLERGEYLANAVANCDACHTKRNLMTGEFVGERFAGGMEFEIAGDDSKVMITPNLTPSSKGRMAAWDEEQFVGRFGVGMGIEHTHMPWRQYQKMSESDVRSIYRYLRTLKPVEVDPGPSVQEKKKG